MAATDLLEGKPCTASAIRDSRVTPDARGLMPLDDARRWLDARASYRKGEGEMKDGTFVLESDVSWAAILSLEGANEFVAQATRLDWQFQVRGMDNLAPLERYGEAILPWLQSRLKKGVLYNVPWCVLPCLLAIGTRAALVLALDVRAVQGLVEGQPQLGGGPGAFAHDEVDRGNAPVPEVAPEDARTLLGRAADLDVARQFIGRHLTLYGELATLAEEGNPRAEVLLRDRVKALGAIVHDALLQSLGDAKAKSVAARFGLEVAPLPPAVQAIFDEAETIDEPKGPLWSIAEMDAEAADYSMPIWDNAYYTVVAMKLTGFASRHGDVLFVECLSNSPRHRETAHWSLYAYGPGAIKRSSGQELFDVKEEEMDRIDLGDEDYVESIGLHICLYGERDAKGKSIASSSEWRKVPVPLPMEEQILTMKRPISGKKTTVHADWHLPKSFAALTPNFQKMLRHVTPIEAMLVQLAARHPNEIFAADEDLAKRCKGAGQKLFAFTRFQWPSAGEPASSSIDLTTIIAAIRARKKITRLPGNANSVPEYWVTAGAEMRSYDGGDAWPDDESPIDERPEGRGAGVSPYWSWLIARGYPHGAMMMHSTGWNQKGGAEQTVPYLVNAAAPAMQVFWPRRAAIMWARAVGFAKKKWSADDAGVVRAVKHDEMLYAAEAAELVAAFVGSDLPLPRHAGSDFVDVLEALVGGARTVTMFADALTGVKITSDKPALAGAIFELGFVLRRIVGERKKVESKLAKRWTKAMQASSTDVARALDLVLHGKEGAERSARTELDFAFAGDVDRAWARERILSAAPSRPSAFLVAIAGDALIDKYMARAANEDGFLAAQLAKLRGDRAVRALLELHAREAMRSNVEQAFKETRPDANAELARALEGPLAAAAKAVQKAIGS